MLNPGQAAQSEFIGSFFDLPEALGPAQNVERAKLHSERLEGEKILDLDAAYEHDLLTFYENEPKHDLNAVFVHGPRAVCAATNSRSRVPPGF